MRNLIKVFILFPLLLIMLSVFLKGAAITNIKDDTEVFSCLVAGYDAVAENTDVLFIFSYNTVKNEGSVIQIPRDTYCNFDGEYGKINRIYTLSRSLGHSEKNSMNALAKSVEEYFGIHLDGYIGLSGETFIKFVDIIGGVYVNIPDNFSLEGLPVKLSHGENLLSGSDAEKFVRHRASYATGDLGRVDAQKIFLDGVFHTIFERVDSKKLIKLMMVNDRNTVADIPIFRLVSLMISHYSELKTAKLSLLTIPGEAKENEGVWYYVVNRNASQDALNRYLYSDSENFDTEYKLTNENNMTFREVYFKNEFSYKVYSNGEVIDIKSK